MNLPAHFRLRVGFTMIELLIVIAIIGILVSVGSVSYTAAQRRARDSRRQADVRAVQNAFEQYYADNNAAYPAGCTSITSTYLPGGIPTDPKAGNPGYYQNNGDCTAAAYCFCAEVESTSNGNSSNNTCTGYTSSGQYFCKSNLQ